MKMNPYPFQDKARASLIKALDAARQEYAADKNLQIISFTAPTGAGKTLMAGRLFEDVFYGTEDFLESPNSIFLWLSDSPDLNIQTRNKFEEKADKININQLVILDAESFDRETLEDGHIYFLNTQKLGKASDFVKHKDGRDYTIWETIQNTIDQKGESFCVVIDEAHRGARDRAAATATTIMQKFILGSPSDNLSPCPIVIGISATIERFNALASHSPATLRRVIVPNDEVRESGLLKDRICLSHPIDGSSNEMSVFEMACGDWKDKSDRWLDFYDRDHSKKVNPIFIVQVTNTTGNAITGTDLSDCLRIFEQKTGVKLKNGDVVHAFGSDAPEVLHINNIDIYRVEPTDIQDDRNIKIVFFKEKLTTGWDCPRAETMMSFRRAIDTTYIAQLLGRMIRTPLQKRIQDDEVLNNIRLYLPHFDAENSRQVIQAFQDEEGGAIPTDIIDTEITPIETLSVMPNRTQIVSPNPVRSQVSVDTPPSGPLFNSVPETAPVAENPTATSDVPVAASNGNNTNDGQITSASSTTHMRTSQITPTPVVTPATIPAPAPVPTPTIPEPSFNRLEVLTAINNMQLKTAEVRRSQAKKYLQSMFSLASLLTLSGLYPNAKFDIFNDILSNIHNYIESKKSSNTYESDITKVLEFNLQEEEFDIFGARIDENGNHIIASATFADIDRRFKQAEAKLGNEGIGNAYGNAYMQPNIDAYKLDIILYASDQNNLIWLDNYSKNKFHSFQRDYRLRIGTLSQVFKDKYRKCCGEGDLVSWHSFALPLDIQPRAAVTGKEYIDHLYVNPDTGKVRIALNPWEEGVISAEQKRDDFVCWLRNNDRKPWSFCIPYKKGNPSVDAATYPDFIIIRRSGNDYIVDLLEPHDPTRDDNLEKAKGFVAYAKDNSLTIGRVQLIRKIDSGINSGKFHRLDMTDPAVQARVDVCVTNAELNNVFNDLGQIDN